MPDADLGVGADSSSVPEPVGARAEMPDGKTAPLANGDSGGVPPQQAAAAAEQPPAAAAAPRPDDGTSDWIDARLVAEAVGLEPADIHDIRIKPAVAAGDNYCSCMWRLRATASDREIQLIVKAPPTGELMQDFVSNLGFFRREIKMLSETLPRMRALARERCGPDHVLARSLGPVCLPCSTPGVLVMEDLSVDGYRNKERQGQLDLQHCELALEILSRLHALSVALYREDPTSMEGYEEPFFKKDPGEFEAATRVHSKKQLERFGDRVDTWEGTKGTQLGEKCRRLAEHIFEDMCDAVAPNEGGGNVLNHGDFWINNMMFLYEGAETENPREVQMVDLQLVRYSSPALDLQYFMFTSPREQVREEHMDDMLQLYCDHFNEYVTALGHPDAQRGFEELKQEFLDRSVFGFTAVYSVTCAVVAEPDDRLRLEEMTKDNMEDVDFSSKAWAGKNFQRIIPKLMKHFVDVGVLK